MNSLAINHWAHGKSGFIPAREVLCEGTGGSERVPAPYSLVFATRAKERVTCGTCLSKMEQEEG